MDHAALPVTSLLFWIMTAENQTGPIEQTVAFVKIFFKEKENTPSFFWLQYETQIFQGHSLLPV